MKEEKELRLTMGERRAVVKATARRYQRGRKKEKQKLLDEFVELTGYNRSYAHGVGQLWPAGWQAEELSGQWAAGDEPSALRSESAGGAAAYLDDPGLHMWETTSGDHAGGAAALGVLRGVQV